MSWLRYPLKVLLAVAGAGALLLATRAGYPRELTPGALVAWPVMLIAAFTLARSGAARGRQVLAGSGLVLSLVVLWWSVVWSRYPDGDAWDVFRNALLVVLALATAWMLGDVARARRETAAVRLAAGRAKAAEHDRAVAAEERARIARELHDITAHHISVVTLQAGAARLLAESGRNPDPAALAAIENTARQAMIEIRQALGVIRSTRAAPLPCPDSPSSPSSPADWSPPG
jgi:signal transduction histidine kinase